ncbi:elongation factor G-like protein [Arthrobacter sp. Hiyo4]|nr:elongation factor G-like protein [Arthrobacter sp. Hiyo4]
MPVAVEADSRSDEDALARSLAKVAAGDPTLRVERNAETHQLILWCMGRPMPRWCWTGCATRA